MKLVSTLVILVFAMKASCFSISTFRFEEKYKSLALRPPARNDQGCLLTMGASKDTVHSSFAQSKKEFLSVILASTLILPNIMPFVSAHAAAPPEINEAENFKVLKVWQTSFPVLTGFSKTISSDMV